MVVEDVHLGRRIGIADVEAHEESVELRFGKCVGAVEFDRVLGRENDERLGHESWDTVDRHLMLLHRLEQRRLGLGRRSVDLIGDHDVREDRAVVELEAVLPLVVDLDAGDVGGEQVGRELDALQRSVDRFGQRAGERGLADAGYVLDQQVPVGQHAGDGEPDHVGLALQHPFDTARDLVEVVLETRDLPEDCIVLTTLHAAPLRGAGTNSDLPRNTVVISAQLPC